MFTSELMARSDEVRSAIAAHRAAIGKAAVDTEGFKPSHDLHAFSLEPLAKILQPFAFPLVQLIPRKMMNPKSDVSRWKTLTGLRPLAKTSVAVEDGAVGPRVLKTTADVTQNQKRLAISDRIIDDAQVFGTDFEPDMRATADLIAFNLLQEAEDRVDLNGNPDVALSAPSSVVGALGGVGTGAISVGLTLTVKVTALTSDGLFVSRQSGYTGAGRGESVVSVASAAFGPTAANDSLALTWDEVDDDVAYNVYIDVGGGGFFFERTVETNAFTLLVDVTPGSAEPGADTSRDQNDYLGLLQQLRIAGAPILSLDNVALTASAGSKTIEEIDAKLLEVYKADHTGPTHMLTGPDLRKSISEKIGGSTTPALSINLDANGTQITGGSTVDVIFNPHARTGDNPENMIPLISHPDFPAGLLLALRLTNPYQHSRLAAGAIDKDVSKEYWRTPFAKDDYSEKFGISVEQTLRVLTSQGSFILKNVAV